MCKEKKTNTYVCSERNAVALFCWRKNVEILTFRIISTLSQLKKSSWNKNYHLPWVQELSKKADELRSKKILNPIKVLEVRDFWNWSGLDWFRTSRLEYRPQDIKIRSQLFQFIAIAVPSPVRKFSHATFDIKRQKYTHYNESYRVLKLQLSTFMVSLCLVLSIFWEFDSGSIARKCCIMSSPFLSLRAMQMCEY